MASKKKPAVNVADEFTTVDVTDLFVTSGKSTRRYNPDPIVGKRGLGIFAKMLADEQVKAVTEFRTSAILARGIEFYYPSWCGKLSEEDKALRINVFQQMCDQMEVVNFDEALEGIATGFYLGFSVSEKVSGQMEFEGQTFNVVKAIMLRDPGTFEFETNSAGIVNKIEQKVSGKPNINLPLESAIHYVHRPQWDYVYGRSDIHEAYRAWYAKDQLIKLWLLYIERFGGGVAIATRDEKAPKYNTPEYDSLITSLSKIASGRSIVLPIGVALDLKFPQSGDIHEKAAVFFDLSIAKAVLVPNLLGLSHTGQTGSYSQSETQLKAFGWTLNKNARRLEAVLNDQIFTPVGRANWDDGNYPRARFKQATPEHIKWMIEQFLSLVNAKAAVATEDDERHLRQALNMPVRDEKSKPLVSVKDEVQKEVDAMNTERAISDAQDAVKKATGEAADAKKLTRELVASVSDAVTKLAATPPQTITLNSTLPPNAGAPHYTKSFDGNSGDELGGKVVPHGKLKYASEYGFNAAISRVAFAVIDRNVESSAAQGVSRLADLVARSVSRALGSDADVSLLLDADTADISAVTLTGGDVAKIKSASSDLLSQGWRVGIAHASSELERARNSANIPAATADQRLSKFAALNDKAAGFFESKAFRMAGDTSDQTKKVIQQELMNGVKYGKPVAEVRAAIWNRLVEKGLTAREAARGIETDDAVNAALDALWLDTPEQAVAYLNTLVRTNMFEALNEARFQEFNDPALGDFVQAFEYAAVMDSSTTEICQHLDGKVFAKDAPEWDEYRPPNHFNCRSVLVAVTTIDEWNGKESAKPTISPAKDFK